MKPKLTTGDVERLHRQRGLAGTLLRAMLSEPTVVGKVIEAVDRGCLVDLRMRHVFHAVAESRRALCSPLAYIHGEDMRSWFDAEANCYEMRSGEGDPVEAAIAALAALERLRDEHMLDVLGVKAREAQAAGNNDEYLRILGEQQEIRRRIKTITF